MRLLLCLALAGCTVSTSVPEAADADADAGPADAAQAWIDSPTWGPYNEGDAGEYRASWLEAGGH